MSADVTSMNVAALKALCKSRGIKGYSKLSRQALLGKLDVSNANSSPKGQSSHEIVSSVVEAQRLDRPDPIATRAVNNACDASKLVSSLSTSPPSLLTSSSFTQGGYTRSPTETNTNCKPSGSRQIIDILTPTTHPEATVAREPSGRILSDANASACYLNQPDGRLSPIIASGGGNEEPQPPKANATQLRRKSDHTVPRSAKRQKGATGRRPESPLVSALVGHSSESSATINAKIPSQPAGLIDTVPNHAASGFASDHAIRPDASSNLKASTNVIDVQFMIHPKESGRSNPLLPATKPFIRHFPKPSTSLSISAPDITPKCLHSTALPILPRPLYHLDLPVASDPPKPQGISMPPRIIQRAMTDQLSIILTTLSDSDRGVCLLVSKSWRYAVYLSAFWILQHCYAGVRLEEYLQPFKSSLSQLSLWPYLRYREAEQASRRKAFNESFLANKLLVDASPIHRHLWCSLDHERQIVVAMRFLEARVWLSAKINDDRVLRWASSAIVDAQPLKSESTTSNSDIWKIYLQKAMLGRVIHEVLFVLQETGEVIGHSPDNRFIPQSDSSAKVLSAETESVLRFDWHNQLSQEMLLGQGSLKDLIRWTNIEDYDHGISKHWLRRMAARDTNALNTALVKVAERYILANVAGNSLSGSFMTPVEMVCESNGQSFPLPPTVSVTTIPSLFVPEHHYIESVHFANRSGIPLHPAIVVVQTPAREYFILRDTGQEIGCEEAGGVYRSWSDVIRCRADGVSE